MLFIDTYGHHSAKRWVLFVLSHLLKSMWIDSDGRMEKNCLVLFFQWYGVIGVSESSLSLDPVPCMAPLCGYLPRATLGIPLLCVLLYQNALLSKGLLSSHFRSFQSMVPASALLWWRSQNWWCHSGGIIQRKLESRCAFFKPTKFC